MLPDHAGLLAMVVRCSHSSSTFMLLVIDQLQRQRQREAADDPQRGLCIASVAAAFHGLPHCKSTAISHSSPV
jgi:hypothetical protein